MKKNISSSFVGSVVFFCLGVLALIMGVNGKSVAIFISRPAGDSSWLTSERMIDGFTYIPIFISVFLFILAIVTFAVSLNNLQKGKD